MKNYRSHSIIIILLTLGLFALLAASLGLSQRNVSALTQQSVDLQNEVAQRVAKDVADLISHRESELSLLANTQNIMLLEKSDQVNTISALIAAQSEYEEIALLNSEGQEIARVGGLKVFPDEQLRDRATTPEFEMPKASGQVYYSPMQFHEATGEPYMTIAVPFHDVLNGGVNGILTANIRFRAIWNLMSGAQVPGNGIVYVVDGENRVIAHRDPAIVLQDTHVELPDKDGLSPGLAGDEVSIAITANRFGTQEFRTVAEQPANEALSSAQMNLILIGSAILLLLVIAVVTVLSYKRAGK